MIEYCIRHNKKHDHPQWRYTQEGWHCLDKVPKFEWVPKSIKDSRKQYAKDMIQPWKQGEFSKEFRDTYPHQAKKMVERGDISKKEHDNAKNVWY